MRDRVRRACRRVVPAVLRDTAFDPAVEDLAFARIDRRARCSSAAGRAWVEVRYLCAVLSAALVCDGLALAASIRATPRALFRLPSRATAMLTSDVRYAVRMLRRQPLVTLVTAVTLALGIGANVAFFNIADAILFAPLPGPHPERLVRAFATTEGSSRLDGVSFPTFLDVRNGSTTVSLAAHAISQVRFGDDAGSEAATVELVSGDYFGVLGLAPAAGRLLVPADDVMGSPRAVAVIAQGLWRRRFGADPAIVGRTVRLNGTPFEIVGVAPAGFVGAFGTHAAELWTPLATYPVVRPRGTDAMSRGWEWLSLVGRLRDGVSRAAAESELTAIARSIPHDQSPADPRPGFVVASAGLFPEPERRAASGILALAFGLTALLLVATCANVSGVLQARLVGRRLEMAVRQSLGAGRLHLVRQWLVESLLLAALGAAGGLLVARATVLLIARMQPPPELTQGFHVDVPLDVRGVLFTIVVAVVAAGLCGLAPALRAGGVHMMTALKEASLSTTGGRRGARLRRSTVGVQIALSVVLLIVAGLLGRSLANTRAFDPGFRTERLALVGVDTRVAKLGPEETRSFMASAIERLGAVAGVEAVTTGLVVPLSTTRERLGFRVPGYVPPDGRSYVSIDYNVVGPRYFEIMGIPIVKGTDLDRAVSGEALAVVINEAAARRFWAGRDPVGETLTLAGSRPVALRVVGVAQTISYYDIGEAARPYIYVSADAVPAPPALIHLRASVPVATLLPTLEREIEAIDARVMPIATSFEQMRSLPLFPGRALASLAAGFGLVALVLCAVGLYGVVAASVGQRTREIGVRMAFGAQPRDVVGAVVREAVVLAAIGCAIGLALGAGAAQTLESQLFNVSPLDPVTYLGVAALLGAIALAAAWAPARRAARIDPVQALREG